MSSTNQPPSYKKAEAGFLAARSDEERLFYLEEMIRECPRHKSAEKMLAQLKLRKKRLLEKIEKLKTKEKIKNKKNYIKKEELQAVIIGLTNSGKSSLLSILTNAHPEIGIHDFTTKKPNVGALKYKGVTIQILENPAINSEYYDKNLTNNTDVIIILINTLEELEEIEKVLNKARGKKLVVFNKKNEGDIRKILETLQSKNYNFVIISTKTKENIDELKEKIFQCFEKIRVYTKEPGKERSEKPLLLGVGATIKEVAKRILKDPESIKETRVWGPSSKFPGQLVGLDHILKDEDIVEFRTR